MNPIATYEEIIEMLLSKFHPVDKSIRTGNINWEHFMSYSSFIHKRLIIPASTISPIMRRFLYMIASCKRPVTIVAAGVYAGYGLSWLIGGAASGNISARINVTGIDIDETALAICKKNLSYLPVHKTLLVKQRAEKYVYREKKAIDFLFIDIDDKKSGKAGYADVLNNFYPALSDTGYVLAHDSNEKKFSKDFIPYHRLTCNKDLFSYSVALPIDSCGITISIKK